MPVRSIDSDILDYSQVLTPKDIKNSELVQQVYPWFYDISWPVDTVFVLNINDRDITLPDFSKYSLVILSFHTEGMDFSYFWRETQEKYPSTQFIVLEDQFTDNPTTPPNVTNLKYRTWHYQISNAIDTYGYTNRSTRKRTHKFSSLTSRATYTKLRISAHMLANYRDDTILSILDNHITEMFDFPLEIVKLDNFQLNCPTYNFNWDFQYITNSAINITNESYFGGHFFYLTEKTWRPMLGATAILHNGNTHFYKKMTSMGFKFDFSGEIDLSYDRYTNHVLNAEKLCSTIDELAKYSTDEIVELTNDDVMHNLQYIVDPLGFYKTCEQFNESVISEFKKLV